MLTTRKLGTERRARYWTFIRPLYFYDPAPTLRRLQVPTLALFGELDNNILAEKNKAAWESEVHLYHCRRSYGQHCCLVRHSGERHGSRHQVLRGTHRPDTHAPAGAAGRGDRAVRTGRER